MYVIPLNDTGRKPKNYPLLHAHLTIIVLDPKAYWLAIGAASHSSNRESVTTWLGASNRILTSGFYLVIFIIREIYLLFVFLFIPFEYLSCTSRLELPLFNADAQIIYLWPEKTITLSASKK